ncbi:MAG: sulfatase, partial [Deltaproteobacteria bacterium]|nr:sulfatase [Deltaproteobacteria bacterium]
ASILTGRLPSSHGVMAKSDALSDAVTTLPEVLKTVGYATAGYATNFNLAPYFNFHQGFDEYVYLEPAFVLGADDASAKLLLMQLIRQRIEKMRAVRGEVLPGTAYQDAETVNDALTSWIDRRAASPWFLFVGYMDPHDPYFSHPYDGSGYARAAHQHPDPSEAPALTALYDGEISYWDDEFGKLLDGLRERGLYEDLTIIVTSDHGEEFNDHGGFWHGTTLYDEQVHVPLLVKLPQARRGGTVVRHWVQSIDLMPTVLVRELDGTDEYKLINANRDNPRGLKPIELYRVDLDPSEQENLASSSPDQIRMTTKALLEQRALAKEGGVAADSVEIDDDVAAHLEAIGYIER